MKTSKNCFAFALLAVMGCGGNSDEASTPLDTADTSASNALLTRALAYHDPDGVYGTLPLRLEWSGTDAEGAERTDVELMLYPDAQRFDLSGRYRGSAFEYHTEGSTWQASVDGATDPAPDVMERMRLDREEGLFWRDYYGFLVGLPMKLRDPGTLIDPDTTRTTFAGRDVLAIRVSYDPDVGSDTWYFYFDPETAALVGCRFYHDESANDGEYIVLEDVIEAGGLRLPRHRRWYMNADDRFLGADEVRRFEFVSED